MSNSTEAVRQPDITDWLTAQRDFHATSRKTLMDAIQRRDDAVKLGLMTPEEAAIPNKTDLLAAHEHDTLSLRYYTALSEIQTSRKRLEAMTSALQTRGHYSPELAEVAEGR